MASDQPMKQPLERMLSAIFFEYGRTWRETTLHKFGRFILYTAPLRAFPNQLFDSAALRRFEHEFVAQQPANPFDSPLLWASLDVHTVRVRLEASSGYMLGATHRLDAFFGWLDTVRI